MSEFIAMAIPAFFALVRNRPLPELSLETPICPHCGGRDVISRGRSTTLVGWNPQPGDKEGCERDPNEISEQLTCKTCALQFCLWQRHGNAWMTDKDHRLLSGVPSSFGHVIYRCRHCDGDVRLHDTEPDGATPARCRVITIRVTETPLYHYRVFARCSGCERSVEVDPGRDYYHGMLPPRDPVVSSPLFRVIELVGECIVNDEAITRANFN